jgi:hypothetical protein
MKVIKKFPKQFKHINKRVKKIVIVNALSRADLDEMGIEEGYEEDYRVCEWWAVLKNGRIFGFAGATPEYIREHIDRGEYPERKPIPALVWSGLILMNEVSLEAIFEALEGCLESSEGIQQFGYRMSGGKRKRKKSKKRD